MSTPESHPPVKDGGPAFGHAAENGHCCGMTLREYFAGQALTAMVAQYYQHPYAFAELVAEKAYEYADAMLAQRAKEATQHG